MTLAELVEDLVRTGGASGAPTEEQVRRVVAHGREGLTAVLRAERRPPPPGYGDIRAWIEYWHVVLAGFAKSSPRLLAEAFDRPEPEFDTSGLIWVMSDHPSPEIAGDLLRWMEHEDAWVREHAIKGLIRLRWAPALPRLLEFLDRRVSSNSVFPIVDGMYSWKALQRPEAAPALRRLGERLARQGTWKGVEAWANGMADALERGTEPPPRDLL